MKQCSLCNQTYTDDQLNFCLNDGELLRQVVGEPQQRPYKDDSPPTLIMNDPRTTNPASWQSPSAPPAVWQGQQPYSPQPAFGQFAMMATPNQTLAIVSLSLGIASMTIGWCCYLGVLLSPAALITGFIALSQIKKDPRSYGGRGLAIGGLATGAAYLALLVLIIVIYGAAIFLGSLGN